MRAAASTLRRCSATASRLQCYNGMRMKSAPHSATTTITAAAFSSFAHVSRAAAHKPVEAVRESERVWIVDARSEAEWSVKRIAGSVSMPAEDEALTHKHCELLDKDFSTFVYCEAKSHLEPVGDQEPTKALRVADRLLAKGYEDVHVVEADLDELVKTGLVFISEQESS